MAPTPHDSYGLKPSNPPSTFSTSNKVEPLVISAADIAARPPEQFPPGTDGGNVTWKTLVSAPDTPTNTFSSGIATCSSENGFLKCHRHTHAEIYHVISGTGVVRIDGEEFGVGEGSVVFIPGDAEHGVRCTGREELRWLYVFATDSFGDVVYRFEDRPGQKVPASKL